MSQFDEFDSLSKKEKLLREAAQILSVPEKDLPKVVERFLKEIQEMRSRSS
jgi:hypothetical protein